MAHAANHVTPLLRFAAVLKLAIVFAVLLTFTLYGSFGGGVKAYVTGPPPGHTGGPGEMVTCVLCHSSYEQDSGPGVLAFIGPKTYALGQEHLFAVVLAQKDRMRYGFQVTALDGQGRPAGTLEVFDPKTTQLAVDEERGRTYVQHTEAGTIPVEQGYHYWYFKWIAPEIDIGEVGLYAAGNAANGDLTPEEDYIYTAAAGVVAETIGPVASHGRESRLFTRPSLVASR